MFKLNSNIWENEKSLYKDVKEKLLIISKIFLKNIDVPIKIKNIFLTGSLASYSWTALSDLDLHIIVDVLDENCLETSLNYFDTKSKLFNKEHEIFIKGYKVEVNIKTEETKLQGKSIYDLLKSEWLIPPSIPTRTMADDEVLKISNKIKKEIDIAIETEQNIDVLKTIRDKIKKLRTEGLKEEGEFSIGNLAFKRLRRDGYIEKLFNYKNQLENEELSLESFKKFFINI
jgi:hypothetical protein